MPIRYCGSPGCPEIAVRGRWCVDHDRERKRQTRSPNASIYRSRRWQILRLRVLAENPICVGCDARLAEHVDHIVDIQQGGAIWKRSNLQALCVSCHSVKTMKTRRS